MIQGGWQAKGLFFWLMANGSAPNGVWFGKGILKNDILILSHSFRMKYYNPLSKKRLGEPDKQPISTTLSNFNSIRKSKVAERIRLIIM